MKQLPTNISPYKQTPVFSEETLPSGLLTSHQTKENTWGKIVVLEGELLYRILEPELEEVYLSPAVYGVVEPQVIHQVQLLGQVRFYVEFYR